MKERYNRKFALFTVLLVLTFLCFNLSWIIFAKNKIHSEDVLYLNEVKESIAHNENFSFLNLLFEGYSPVPKLIPAIFLINGIIPKEEIFLLNLALTLGSAFLISAAIKKIYGTLSASAFIIIFLSFPATTFMSRSLNEQVYMLFFLSLSYYFLIRSENFANKKFSVLYGLSLGLFLLSRQLSIIFCIPQFLHIFLENKKMIRKYLKSHCFPASLTLLFYTLTEGFILVYLPYNLKFYASFCVTVAFLAYLLIKSVKSSFRISNMNYSLMLAFVVSIPWYINMVAKIFIRYLTEDTVTPYLHTIDFIYYAVVFITTHSNLILSIILAFIIIQKVQKERYQKYYWLLIIIPYFIFSMFPVKSTKPTFLFVVPISILASIRFRSLKKVSLILAVAVFGFFMAYNSFPLEHNFQVKFNLPYVLPLFSNITFTDEMPLISKITNNPSFNKEGIIIGKEYQKEDNIYYVAKHIRPNATVAVITESQAISADTLNYYDEDNVRYINLKGCISKHTYGCLEIPEYDYLIMAEYAGTEKEAEYADEINLIEKEFKKTETVKFYEHHEEISVTFSQNKHNFNKTGQLNQPIEET